MTTSIHFKPLGQGIKDPVEYQLSDINGRLIRSSFFDGRLLTAEDLSREQVYIDERLRELGRAYGQGIINGLEVQLAAGQLTINPGQALSPSGRVLLLSEQLSIDLDNAARIRQLNNNEYSYINYGLYAIVLKYAQQSQQIAEVFPTRLSQSPEPQANIIAEGVSVSLVKLSVSLNQQDPFAVREQLMAAEGRHQPIQFNLPEEAIALGIMAFDNNRPVWLDSELLRQPFREEITEQNINEDFFRRHYKLYRDILEDQQYSGVKGKFYAAEFFSTLPPVGPLPKSSIDPQKGTQSYFPEHYSVNIVPVNYNELNTILSESMSLNPLLLDKPQSEDIMILAPLQGQDFLTIAQQMEGTKISLQGELPAIKPLTLASDLRPYLATNPDQTHWDMIWNRLQEEDLYYIKRPQRTAETGVSAIVLARGAIQQEETDTLATDSSATITGSASSGSSATIVTAIDNSILNPALDVTHILAGSNSLMPSGFKAKKINLLDEDETVLRHINLQLMATNRPPENSFEKNALEKLLGQKTEDASFTLQVMNILMFIDRRYNRVLWRTLLQLANKGNSQNLLDYLRKNAEKPVSTASLLLNAGSNNGLPLTDSLKKQWLKLSQEN